MLPKLEFDKENITEYFNIITKEKINVVLEIGFGSGENLLNLISKSDKKYYFIGCEPYLNGMATFLGSLNKENYKRVKVFKNDVRELLSILPKESLSEIFILFPDPWPKARHEKRRLMNKNNLYLFLACLKNNGTINIATDVKSYFDSIYNLFESSLNFEIVNLKNFKLRPKNIIITRYEKKAKVNKKVPFYLQVKKIVDKRKKVF